eukprot:2856129-Rhodomonas_salina.4
MSSTDIPNVRPANRSDSNNHPKPTAESFNDKAKSVSPDLPCYQTDLLQAFNLHQPPEDSPVRHDRDAGTTLPLAMPRHKNQGSGRGATFPSVLEEPADGVVEASPPDFTMNNLPAGALAASESAMRCPVLRLSVCVSFAWPELFRGEQPAAAKKKGTSRTRWNVFLRLRCRCLVLRSRVVHQREAMLAATHSNLTRTFGRKILWLCPQRRYGARALPRCEVRD